MKEFLKLPIYFSISLAIPTYFGIYSAKYFGITGTWFSLYIPLVFAITFWPLTYIAYHISEVIFGDKK